MANPEINPTQPDGEWYDTPEELIEALHREMESLDRRKAYLQSLIDEVVNRQG